MQAQILRCLAFTRKIYHTKDETVHRVFSLLNTFEGKKRTPSRSATNRQPHRPFQFHLFARLCVQTKKEFLFSQIESGIN